MPTKIEPIKQTIKVSDRVDVGQKIIAGVAILCAFTALLNFSILFNYGLQGISQKLVENQIEQSTAILNDLVFSATKASARDRENDVLLNLTRNNELNNLATYITSQQNVNLLAFDIVNNASSTLILFDIRFLAYVNGGYSTTTATSTYLFSPGWSYLDGGVYATSIIENLQLYNYFEGNFIAIASSTPITQQGYINFYDLNHYLPPESTTTFVVKGDITDDAPYGNYPDLVSIDIQDWRRDVYIYNMMSHRVKSGPNNINHGSQPIIYHQITE